ncbi:flavin reductase family protein [Acidaminobacter sp. JC074]|uniref:flavin reductase family protein n=1 Tax=Acidaminobacter sp. JC074 TaxID=2530199 RepID=UPI001F109696|nr:flavin reductase family protein [Acidaminobacter sp. JC074]MCH4886877.1 flavin reductase family protein [Acidaminobacter sp. JC074]
MQKNIGNVIGMYPMPITIVGTEIDGKVNWINIAHVGVIGMDSMMLSMGKAHYSNIGIRKNKTVSISLITADMIPAADYVGLVSGKNTDKSDVFEFFNGHLQGAPLIKNAPVTMECEVVDVFETETNEQFVVKPINTYVQEEYLDENGKIDFVKVSPVLFEMQKRRYLSTGGALADCWHIGKTFKGE